MKKIIILLITFAIILSASAQQDILVSPDMTPVLIDDIDWITYEKDNTNSDSSGENPDILKMYMKDGTVHSRVCGKYSANIYWFTYNPYDNQYKSITKHQNDYSVEWNVNAVGKTDGSYCVGIAWENHLTGFNNVRSGICFGKNPDLNIEESEYVQYVDDSSEFPYNRSKHYMFIGSKLLPMYLTGCGDFVVESHGSGDIVIGRDNWLKVPLEYGETYYYRTFIQGDMMQHGEMKTLTFYDKEKSFRVPKVIDDAGYEGCPIPTEDACQKFTVHFPDSVTPPSRSQLKDLWIEWLKTEEAQKIDLSADCSPIEFDNGVVYDLHRIPDEFYTWLIHRNVIVDVVHGITEWENATWTFKVSEASWNLPYEYYIIANALGGINPMITYRCGGVVPGVRYKLQITFVPDVDNGAKPTRLRVTSKPLENSGGTMSETRLFNSVDIPPTEITVLEADDVTTKTMGVDLVLQTNIMARQISTFSREIRIADIRFVPVQ